MSIAACVRPGARWACGENYTGVRLRKLNAHSVQRTLKD